MRNEMKANRIYTVLGKKETKCARESWHYVTGCSRDVAFVVRYMFLRGFPVAITTFVYTFFLDVKQVYL